MSPEMILITRMIVNLSISKYDKKKDGDTFNDAIEMYRKDCVDIDVNRMSSEEIDNIVNHFKEQGGIIQMDADTDAYLTLKKAEAITHNEKTILLKQKPSRASVFEELIHATQFKNGEIEEQLLAVCKQRLQRNKNY